MASTRAERTDARLPGHRMRPSSANMQMAMALSPSTWPSFKGDDPGANEANGLFIVGMQTAGITEATLTQANKVKASTTYPRNSGLEYRWTGSYAASLSDVRIVAQLVGVNVLQSTWFRSYRNSTR